MDFYEPPVSLWEVIKANTGIVELDEIRSILGPADVDLSLDLRLEVESLLEIWRDLRDEKNGSAAFQFIDQSEVRKRLVSEIKIFVDSIKENPDMIGVVRIENLTSRPVVKLALAEYDRSFHRTSTSFGSDGRETPTGMPSPSRSTPSRASSQLSFEDIVQMKDKFKIDRVLEIVQHLRHYLTEEIAQLKEDVNYLRNSIEEENALLTLTSSDRPTISELRSERNEVEAELKWANENAALLRPLPPQSKRHGSVIPLDKGEWDSISSRPSSTSSISTITTQIAQATSLSSSISPSQSPVSLADSGRLATEEELLPTTPAEPTPIKPHPPSELRNIRVVSGKATTMRSYMYKQPGTQNNVVPILPSKIVSLPASNINSNKAAPTRKAEIRDLSAAGDVVVTSRPPLPPTHRSLMALKASASGDK